MIQTNLFVCHNYLRFLTFDKLVKHAKKLLGEPIHQVATKKPFHLKTEPKVYR